MQSSTSLKAIVLAIVGVSAAYLMFNQPPDRLELEQQIDHEQMLELRRERKLGKTENAEADSIGAS